MRISPRRLDNPYTLAPPSQLGGMSGRPLAIDLFCGAGGITLGLMNAGFEVVFASDISPACAATHQRNFPSVRFHHGDIQQLDGGDVLRQLGLVPGELDLLIGGPPCQGFSILGQRQLDDPRNGLFGEFIRVAGEMRPKAIVIENVPGLATLHGGVILEWIGHSFRELGYNVECAELLAAQYGVPQMRWRMFFVAWRNDLGLTPIGFPQPTHGRLGIGDLVPNRTVTKEQSDGFLTIRDAIGDLPPVNSGEQTTSYDRPPQGAYQEAMRRFAGPSLHNHYAPRLSAVNIQRIQHLQPGQDWRDLPRELLPAGMQRALLKDHTRRFRRMTWDGVARSIITRFRDPKSGEYSHPEQTRTISIREAARIQSFPDWFVFEGTNTEQYDQVGNAVPVLLARAVAEHIKRALYGVLEASLPVKSRYKIPVVERETMATPPRNQGNFVSEWFGHRTYPAVHSNAHSLAQQQAESCPFLTIAKGTTNQCIKPERSRGVCTISTTANGGRRDWLVCPYRALDPNLLHGTVRRLFGFAETQAALIEPAIRLADPEMQANVAARLAAGERVFVYFDEKLGGELSIPGTERSPEFSFDVTIVEVELVEGRVHVGRFGVLEIQTMDFHGSYGHAVRNLKDTLRMFPGNFGQTLQENLRLASEKVEGPNIANVFKRTFYQMMFKFQLGLSDRCAGCALAIPQAVWDSWRPHLGGAPTLERRADGTTDLFKPGQARPAHVPAWIYVFDLDADAGTTPNPIRIQSIIATDAPAFSYYALDVAPAAALDNIGAPGGMISLLAKRLGKLWPDLAQTILIDGGDARPPKRSQKRKGQ